MKKGKIEPRPEVQEYAKYFRERAKRVLGLKDSDFESVDIDLRELEEVEVWFFFKNENCDFVTFTIDGRLKSRFREQK